MSAHGARFTWICCKMCPVNGKTITSSTHESIKMTFTYRARILRVHPHQKGDEDEDDENVLIWSFPLHC